MNKLLIINILAFIAGILSILSTYRKTKKQIVIYEALVTIFRIVLNTLAKSWSDVISKIIKFLAQITTLKDKYNKKHFIIISILYLIICLYITYLVNDLRCLLAIIPAIMEFYSLLKKEVKTYRIYIIISKVFWTINNIAFGVYIAIVFDLFVVIGHIINKNKK